ncbi:hypothetical protein N7522_002155 [Penicillium canescens]|uniref:uncharacterized protein n=1 Tax=Penicillium canescens TaxID=5083 RepID=UPI0026DFB4CE|nr:uncharacterized protein N7446_000120 [Penicillium canescens]KAJ6011800.1 hypothetical protein N7522_002155 [Penicillium canescens]KAJ6059469.1 hypothetical protein N7444_003108 [Penicillium canescens]KAJ6077184.1 hypothetical protein N7446_000120 [Penicillium canescens]KAJ6153953.1 hypothetical protein N7485_012322 [Penicillium canescens]
MDGRIIKKSTQLGFCTVEASSCTRFHILGHRQLKKCSIDVLSTYLEHSLVVVCLYVYPSGNFVAVVITIAFACRPLSYFWEQDTNPETEGMCIDIS